MFASHWDFASSNFTNMELCPGNGVGPDFPVTYLKFRFPALLVVCLAALPFAGHCTNQAVPTFMHIPVSSIFSPGGRERD